VSKRERDHREEAGFGPEAAKGWCSKAGKEKERIVPGGENTQEIPKKWFRCGDYWGLEAGETEKGTSLSLKGTRGKT